MGNEVSQDDAKNMNVLTSDTANPNLYPSRPYNYAFEEGRMLDKDVDKPRVHARKSKSHLKSNQLDYTFSTTGTNTKACSSLVFEPGQIKGSNQESHSTDTLCMDSVEWKTTIAPRRDDNTTGHGLKKSSRTSKASPRVNASKSKAGINCDDEAGNTSHQEGGKVDDDKQLKKTNKVVSKGDMENVYRNVDLKSKEASAAKGTVTTVANNPPDDKEILSTSGKLENLKCRQQESAKEMFPAPQGFEELSGLDLSHLSAEERMMILQVAARAKQIENVEERKIRKIEDQLAVYSKTAQQHTTEPQSSASAVRSAGNKGSDGITENTTPKDKKNSKVMSNDKVKARNIEKYDKDNRENASKEVEKGTKKSTTNHSEKQPSKPPEERLACYMCGKVLASDASNRSSAKVVPEPHNQPFSYDTSGTKHEKAITTKNAEPDKEREKTDTQPVKCGSCSHMVCASCSVKSSLLAKGVLCALCAKQRELVARSNLWLKSPKRNQLLRSQSADTSLDLAKTRSKDSSKLERLPWHGRSYSDSGKNNFFRTTIRKNNTSSSGNTRRNSWIVSSKGGSRVFTDSSSCESSKTPMNQEGLSIYAKKKATVCAKKNTSTAIYEDEEVSPTSTAQQKEAANISTRREMASDVKINKNKSPSRPSVSSVLVKHLSDHEDVKKELKNQKREEIDKKSPAMRKNSIYDPVGSKQGAAKPTEDELVKVKDKREHPKLEEKYSASSSMLVSCDEAQGKPEMHISQVKKNHEVAKGETKRKNKQPSSLETNLHATRNDIKQVSGAQKVGDGSKTTEVDSSFTCSAERSSVTPFKSATLSNGNDAEVVKGLTNSLPSTNVGGTLYSKSGFENVASKIIGAVKPDQIVKQMVPKEQVHAVPRAKARSSKSVTAPVTEMRNQDLENKTKPNIMVPAKDMKKESNILNKRDESPKTGTNACGKSPFKNTEPAVLKEEELDGSDSFFLAVGNSTTAGKLAANRALDISSDKELEIEEMLKAIGLKESAYQLRSNGIKCIPSAVDLHNTYGINYSSREIPVTSGYATEDEEFIVDEKDTEGDFEHIIGADDAAVFDYPASGMKRASRCANLSYSNDPGKEKHQDLSVMSQRNTVGAKVVESPETSKQKVTQVLVTPVKRKKDKVVKKDQSYTSTNPLSPVAEGPDSGFKLDYMWENSDIEQVLNSQLTKVNEYEKNIAMMKNVLENEKTSPSNSLSDMSSAMKKPLPSARTKPGRKVDMEKKEETLTHAGSPEDSKGCSLEKKFPEDEKHMEKESKMSDLKLIGDSGTGQDGSKFGYKTFPSQPLLSNKTTTAMLSTPTSSKDSSADSLGASAFQYAQKDFQELDSQMFSYRYDSDEDDILKSATTSVPTFPETLMKSGLGGVLYGTDEEEEYDYSKLNGSESLPRAKPKKLANMFMKRTTSTDSFEDLLRQFENTASSGSREVTGSGTGARRRSLKPDARKKSKNSSLPSVFTDSYAEDQSGDSSQSSSFSPAKEGNLHPPDKNSEDRRHSLPVPNNIVPVRTTFSDPSDLRLPNDEELLNTSFGSTRPSILVISPGLEKQQAVTSQGTYDRAKKQGREYITKHGTKKKMITSLSGEFTSDLTRESTSSTPSYCSSSSATGLFVNGFARCFSCGTLSTQDITGTSPSADIRTKIIPNQESPVTKMYERPKLRSVDSSTQVSPDTEQIPTDDFSASGLSLADLRRIKSLIEALNEKSELDDLPGNTAIQERKVPVTGLTKIEKIIIPTQDKRRKLTAIYKDASCGSVDHQNVGLLDTVIHAKPWTSTSSIGRVNGNTLFNGLKNESSSQTDTRGFEEIVHYPIESSLLKPDFIAVDSAPRVSPNLLIPSPTHPPAQLHIHNVKPNQFPPVPMPTYPANLNFPLYGYNLPSFPALHSHYQTEQQPIRYPHSVTNPAQMYAMQMSEYERDMSHFPSSVYSPYGAPYTSQFNPPHQMGAQEYHRGIGEVWHAGVPKPITRQPVLRGNVSQCYGDYSQPQGYHYELQEDQRYRDYSEQQREEALHSQHSLHNREKSRRYPSHSKPHRQRRSSKDREAELDDKNQWNMPFSNTQEPLKSIYGLRKCSSVPVVSMSQSNDRKTAIDPSSEAIRMRIPEQIQETVSEFYESETSGTEEMESYGPRGGRKKYKRSANLYSDNEDDENEFYEIREKSSRYPPNRRPSRNRHQRTNYDSECETRTASLPRSSDRQCNTSGRYLTRYDRGHRDGNNYAHEPRQIFQRSSSQDNDRGMTRSLSKRSLPVPPEEDEYNWRYQNARRQAKINPARAIASTLQRNDENVEREVTRLQQTMDDLDQEERELDLRLKYLEVGRSRRSSMTSLPLQEDLRHNQNMEAMNAYGMSSTRQPLVSRNRETIETFLNYPGSVATSSIRTRLTSQLPVMANSRSRGQHSDIESKMADEKKTDKRNYETVDDVEYIKSMGFFPLGDTSDNEDSLAIGDRKNSVRRTSHNSQYRPPTSQDVGYLASSRCNGQLSNVSNAMAGSSCIEHPEDRLLIGEAPTEISRVDPSSLRRATDNHRSRPGGSYNAYYTTGTQYSAPAQDRFTNPDLQWFNDKIEKYRPASNYDWIGNFRLKNELEHFYSLKNNYLNNMHKVMSDRYNYKIQKGSRKSKDHQHRTNKSSSKGEENEYAELVSRPSGITRLQHSLYETEQIRGPECIEELTPVKKSERPPPDRVVDEPASSDVKTQPIEQEDDLRTVVSDSEAYHLRKEMTDWFDKPSDERIIRRY